VGGDHDQTVHRGGDVQPFLTSVPDDRRRQDAQRLVELLGEVTGQPPVMWGASIIGFGARHYRYDSGREGDTAAVGFSPRKAHTVVYLPSGLEHDQDLLARLGRHSTGKGCLYLKRVDQVDQAVLKELLARSYDRATCPDPGRPAPNSRREPAQQSQPDDNPRTLRD
jgi:Domain of unknown function (DU1801)